MLITALLYAGGYIAQFLYHYNTWVSAGGTPGDGSSPPLPDASFFSCLQALTIFPYSIYGISLCLLVAILLLFVVMRMGIGGKGTLDKERNFSYSEKGTYGTSGYMTPEEFRNVLNLTSDIRRSTGIILGTLENKIVCLPESSPYNRNVAVFGASMMAYESVPIAFGAFYATDGHGPDGVLAAINAGDDADTNGSICGSLCGAFSGALSFPVSWRMRVEKTSGVNFYETADQLLTLEGVR